MNIYRAINELQKYRQLWKNEILSYSRFIILDAILRFFSELKRKGLKIAEILFFLTLRFSNKTQ